GVSLGSLPHGSPLRYLRALIAPDGHVRYAKASDQTPVWVTAEALMALASKPLPIAAVPSAAVPSASGPHAAAPRSTTPRATTQRSTTPRAAAPRPQRARSRSPATAPQRKPVHRRPRPAKSPRNSVHHPVAEPIDVALLARAAGFATALLLAPVGVS